MNSHSRNSVVIVFLIFLLYGCNDNQQSVPDNSIVTKVLTLKNFTTGQKISADLKQASLNSKSWSFFGQPRKLEVVTLDDGTVVSIKFPLGSWYDGYQLKDSLKIKYKEEGAVNFAFKCKEENDRIELAGNVFSVSKSICTANDGNQILEITDQHLKYEESFFTLNPSMKVLVDFSNLRLYDPNLVVKKYVEKNDLATKQKESTLKKLEQDIQKAKKDM